MTRRKTYFSIIGLISKNLSTNVLKYCIKRITENVSISHIKFYKKNWVGGTTVESIMKSHFTKFVQSYLLPKKFNLDYRKATLSSQICAREITREQAVEASKAPTYNKEDMEREKEYKAKKLSISKEELNKIIKLPGKCYYELSK